MICWVICYYTALIAVHPCKVRPAEGVGSQVRVHVVRNRDLGGSYFCTMRQLLKRNKWITAFMGVIFLFASSGAMLSRMTCFVGGHSELSIGMADDCCPEDLADGPTITASCCAFTTAQADLTDFVPHPPTAVPPAVWMTVQVMFVQVPLTESVSTTWLDSRPPPTSGPDRLVAFSIHRV